MSATAAAVKELRARTGAGMMDCKNALRDADGDIEKAIENMRKSGVAKAAKKSGRVAAEGAVVIERDAHRAAIVEINSETDFVARDDNFKAFCAQVAGLVLQQPAAEHGDLSALLASRLDSGETVEEARQQLVARIGENVGVRRFQCLETGAANAGLYQHGTRIGVVALLDGGGESLAKDIAMQVAATRPLCVSAADIPGDVLDKEREILLARAAESGKPQEIIERIVAGQLDKFVKEITLPQQVFVKDADASRKRTVAELLDAAGAQVRKFVRYEVGEGLEKRSDNFKEEVMAQARGE